MKLIKVFGVFVLLHLLGWFAAHAYLSSRPKNVLLVVDTSFAMKSKFGEVENWISQYQEKSRYQKLFVATDREDIGELAAVKSKESLFRNAFGTLTENSLAKYESRDVDKKILLSDGSVKPSGWQVVEFK